ncbi:MAG: hypothetical protein ACHP9Y_02975 [Gammaproteobacteria bacterium]
MGKDIPTPPPSQTVQEPRQQLKIPTCVLIGLAITAAWLYLKQLENLCGASQNSSPVPGQCLNPFPF